MKNTNEESGRGKPRRPAKAVAGTLAGLCLGFGLYGVIHGLRVEESAFRLILSSVTLCCGLLLLPNIRKTEKKENR